MKKVLIGFIFVLCLVGGVAIGKIRQQKGKIPGGLVMDATASPESSPAEVAAADATATDAMATESPADAAASETPADSTMASASDTGSSSSSDSSSSSMDTAVASSTPEVASDATAISGRSFGTGGSARKSRSSSGSSGSSGSGSSSSSSSASSAIADSSFSAPTPRKAKASGTPIPDNQVIDVSTPSEDLGAGSESSFDVPPPTSGKKSKTAPAIASSELDDLPTIDDGSAAGGTSPDPFEAGSASAAPTPDPFANAVAMAPPSGGGGGGELNFPSGSGRSLKKVSQKQSGASTVVRIDMSGSAKYRVYKTRAGKVFIDIEETDVPGGASPTVAGSGQVKEISAKPVTNAGGMKLARVQLLVNVTGEKLPNISAETSGNAITVTIGGAASEF